MTLHLNRAEIKNLRRKLRHDMTPCEKLTWKYLRHKQMKYRFLRQYSVDRFILDFYCPHLKLAVEVDGSIHNSVEHKQADAIRQEYIEQLGITFLRITNEELIENSDNAFAKIETLIKELELRHQE